MTVLSLILRLIQSLLSTVLWWESEGEANNAKIYRLVDVFDEVPA